MGWVEFSYAVVDGLAPGDVSYAVTWNFNDWTELPEAFFFYAGLDPQEGVGPTVAGYGRYRNATDGDARVEIHGAVVDQERRIPLPERPPVLDGRNGKDPKFRWDEGSANAFYSRSDLVAFEDQPVWHVIIAIVGGDTGGVTLEGHWNKTMLNVSYGPASSVFLLRASDFATAEEVSIHAEPAHVGMAEDLTMQLTTSNDQRVGFEFLPFAGIESSTVPGQADGRIERPNGSASSVDQNGWLEFTKGSGAWTFSIPRHAAVASDMPLLWGATFSANETRQAESTLVPRSGDD